jgi:GAF domain-containing protein
VINVPIVDGVRVVGVLAILDAAGRYDEESVHAAEAVIAQHNAALVAAIEEARV